MNINYARSNFYKISTDLAGDGVRRGRLADRGLGGAGDSDRGLGAGICRGGEREGRAGLGGAGAGAGEGRLLSRDIDLLAGAGGGADTEESLLRSGLLYSNLIASLIFALLEAVLATDKFLDFLLGDDDLLLVELLRNILCSCSHSLYGCLIQAT